MCFFSIDFKLFFKLFFFILFFKMKNEHTFCLLSLVNKRLQCGTSKTLKAYSESAVPLPLAHLGEGDRWEGLLDRPRPLYLGGRGLLVPAAATVLLHCRAQRSLVF